MRQQWSDYRVFWREFRQAYQTTGAVLPSGPALSKALCRYVRQAGSIGRATNGEPPGLPRRDKPAGSPIPGSPIAGSGRRILEVGPGTGAVTGAIVRAMRPDDRLVLVERNEQFVRRLAEHLATDPLLSAAAGRITLAHASVEDLSEDQPFDLIVSGLPLNNFSAELVETILAKLRRLLAPGGTLSFFEYVAIRRVKSLVSRRAERERLRGVARAMSGLLEPDEIKCDLVLANVPPAWVHHVRCGVGTRN